MTCVRTIDVEDMVLGIVQGAEARELEVHLAACAECRAARDAFEDERALFVTRAPLVAAPPIARVEPRPHGSAALVALACAAAMVLAGNVGALRIDAGATTSAPEPLASYAPSEPAICDDDRPAEPSTSTDRPVCEERVTSMSVGP